MFRERLLEVERQTLTRALPGKLVAVTGGTLLAQIENVRVGNTYLIERAEHDDLLAEVVGFDSEHTILLPFEPPQGLSPGANLRSTELGRLAPDAVAVLGDVIDPLGRSLVSGVKHALLGGPLQASPPSPLSRRPIDTQIETKIRVIDGMLPFGQGQRVGLFAGSGVGKSSLLGQLVRGTRADVVVVALVGERGREVGEFVADTLDEETASRTTIVVATSDAPPMLRLRAAEMATAIAESWRDEGKHCLLLVDSLTRYARALREAALLAGEPPARRGYPASVFARLPCLLERAGQGEAGAISAVYTVLVEGGDMEEPVADEVRGIVDGHWVLRRELAERGHYPAIDVLSSVSRVATRVVDPSVIGATARVRRGMAELARHRDAIDLGIYKKGTSARIDAAIRGEGKLLEFLRQDLDALEALGDTRERLVALSSAFKP